MNELSTDERREILKELLNTGIVGEKWPKFTHLIGFVKDKDGQVIYENCYDSKDHSHHAEIKMLDDSEFLKMVKTGNVNITLTSNYSPCSNCASELEKFYVENNDFIKSCTIRFSFVYYKDIPANRVGLRNLNKAGITLEAMTEDSWSEVSQWLGFSLKELADEFEVRKRDDDTKEK